MQPIVRGKPACRFNDSCYVNCIREGISGQARSEPSVAPGRAELCQGWPQPNFRLGDGCERRSRTGF